MLAEVPGRMVTEWMAFYRVENLGETSEFRADLRAGIVAASVINVAGPKRAVKPDELMPKFEKPAPDSPADNRAKMLAYAERQKAGGADGDAGQVVRGARPRPAGVQQGA